MKAKKEQEYSNRSLASWNFHLHSAHLGFGWGSVLRCLAHNSPPNDCCSVSAQFKLDTEINGWTWDFTIVTCKERIKDPGSFLLLLDFECFILILHYIVLTLALNLLKSMDGPALISSAFSLLWEKHQSFILQEEWKHVCVGMPVRKMFKIILVLLLISNIKNRIHSLFISKLSWRLSYAWAINTAFSQVPATLLIGILFTPTRFDRKHCPLCQEYTRTSWQPWNKCCLM